MKRVGDDLNWRSPEERQTLIMERINATGRVIATQLANEFGVSEDTARRDLRALVDAGLAKRFYGGASRPSSALIKLRTGGEPSSDEGRSIASAAAATIAADTTLIVDAGDISVEFVRSLPAGLSVRIITCAIDVAAAALDHQSAEVVLVGGTLSRSTRSAASFAAMREIRALRADYGVLSGACIDNHGQLRTDECDGASFKAAILNVSRRNLVLATAEEIGCDAIHQIAPIPVNSTVFTNAGPGSLLDNLRRLGVSVRSVCEAQPNVSAENGRYGEKIEHPL